MGEAAQRDSDSVKKILEDRRVKSKNKYADVVAAKRKAKAAMAGQKELRVPELVSADPDDLDDVEDMMLLDAAALESAVAQSAHIMHKEMRAEADQLLPTEEELPEVDTEALWEEFGWYLIDTSEEEDGDEV